MLRRLIDLSICISRIDTAISVYATVRTNLY
jgi:hypothetical protein